MTSYVNANKWHHYQQLTNTWRVLLCTGVCLLNFFQKLLASKSIGQLRMIEIEDLLIKQLFKNQKSKIFKIGPVQLSIYAQVLLSTIKLVITFSCYCWCTCWCFSWDVFVYLLRILLCAAAGEKTASLEAKGTQGQRGRTGLFGYTCGKALSESPLHTHTQCANAHLHITVINTKHLQNVSKVLVCFIVNIRISLLKYLQRIFYV